jgi:predicted ferric reductase/mono/diheme cytochrome c family protein
VLLWARAAPLDTRFDSQYQSLTSLAVVFAFAGTSAFALNLVLGARLRIVEALFGGLDRMYSIHRANGQFAFLLLLGHVILILASRATLSAGTALDLLSPGAGWTVFTGVLAFSAMTVAMLLTLFMRLGHEVFVYVQRSFGFVFLAATYHVFTTEGAKATSPALTWYMAALSTLGIAAFAYRSLLGNVLVRRRRYRVEAVNRLDDSVTEIVMAPLGQPLRYTAGQFLFVNFRSRALELHPLEVSLERQVLSVRPGEVANQFHPFSITSAPGEKKLRITVKAVGDYTQALRKLEPGVEAIVEGAYGSFSHRHAGGTRQLWLAGGIGVTPFLSMARSLGAKQGPAVDFYYCVEHADEAHFLDELEAIAARRTNFRVVVVPRDVDGLLTAERLEEELGDLSSAHALICGPPAMIKSLKAQLVDRGMRSAHIQAEEFGFAKPGGGELDRERWFDRPALTLIPALASAGLLIVAGVAFAGWMSARDGNGTAAINSQPAGADAGRTVFATAGCADCHSLQAADAGGESGPDLDETKPNARLVRDVVTNGKGAMPPFGGELTDQQIESIADFVSNSAGK